MRLNPPDMVIMMNYPGTLANDYFTSFGEDRPLIPGETTAYGDLTVHGSADETQGYAVLPAELQRGKSYVLTMEGIQVQSGTPEGAAVELYEGEKRLDLTIFDIEYGSEFGFRWGFQIPEREPEGAYQLRFYAGITKATEGVTLDYRGIRLQEMTAEAE